MYIYIYIYPTLPPHHTCNIQHTYVYIIHITYIHIPYSTLPTGRPLREPSLPDLRELLPRHLSLRGLRRFLPGFPRHPDQGVPDQRHHDIRVQPDARVRRREV